LIYRLGLSIEYRDAKRNKIHRQELLTEGGQIKVPCLRIEEGSETRWLYESRAINAYLSKKF
jgi:glutathione S-transferase